MNENRRAELFRGPFLIMDVPVGDDPEGSRTMPADILDFLDDGSEEKGLMGKFVVPLETRGQLFLGRDVGADTGVSIPDSQISQKHASITLLPDGSYLLADLASSNGTTVNDLSLPPMGTHRLTDRDKIAMGKSEIQFYLGPTFVVLVRNIMAKLNVSG